MMLTCSIHRHLGLSQLFHDVLCTPERVVTVGQGGDSVNVESHKTVAKETHKLLGLMREKHFGSLSSCREKYST